MISEFGGGPTNTCNSAKVNKDKNKTKNGGNGDRKFYYGHKIRFITGILAEAKD